jgi:2-polyprenyl-3-methyl-5-hydroxy-6-metoxy-1,4-benzoquinol methylase
VTVKQLRDYPDDAELARLYAQPHDHHRWVDHELRVAVTVDVGLQLPAQAGRGPYTSVADLSCGNGTIPARIAAEQHGHAEVYLGDYAVRYHYHGPLEKTLNEISDVDLYVCSETIEHLRDPNAVLRRIRAKAQVLLLSTPIGETAPALGPGGNPEHVWGWGVDDVGVMLRNAGWDPVIVNQLQLIKSVYDFQIWACT